MYSVQYTQQLSLHHLIVDNCVVFLQFTSINGCAITYSFLITYEDESTCEVVFIFRFCVDSERSDMDSLNERDGKYMYTSRGIVFEYQSNEMTINIYAMAPTPP